MCSCFGINCNFSIPRRRSINDLEDNWLRLKAERDQIEKTIEENPEIRPLEVVKAWLRPVATLEGKIEKLITYYNGLHPRINRIKSCYSRRKTQLMNQEVLDLLQQRPESILERPRIRIPAASQVPTEPTTGMQFMLDEIWSHVENQQDDHGRVIGLYGMGGVGKTTLLKALNNKLCTSTQIFDLQFWILASKTPNLINIQNHIGEKIGFRRDDWKVKSQDEKAAEIYNVLLNKKYILLLDDLWDRFDLREIGIPLPNLTNKSMVIFTTRSKEICHQMKARPIKVQLLEEKEAWNLFKENVGEMTLNAHHDIPDRARVLMKECKGLPLALVVIGRSMSSKTTIHEWEYAIQVLQGYTSELSSTVTDQVFIPLKYSYDNLTNDAIRSCFLYCSLYAEDQEISKSDLVDKWIGEGFLGRFHDLDKDRNEGYSYISNLVQASLLQKCPLEENVKMHDVIRDMALWITGDSFYVKARAGLTKVPKDVKWKHVEKLSLMDNSIAELNNGPTQFTNLKTMLCNRGKLSSINNDFWMFVPNLKVLDLSHNRGLTSLPEEFGDMVSLQYLNVSHTALEELPNEFHKLVKVKYLNVEYTKIYTIPEGILSNMKELCMFRCGHRRYFTSWYDFLGENLVKEFEGLKYLRDVQIPATSKVEISNLTSSINLLTCITQFTMSSFIESTSLDILFLKEMNHLRFLRIECLENVEKIVVGEGQDFEASTIRNQNGFNTLRKLEIHFCSCLTNLSWLVFLPNIESLEVTMCSKMQTLVSENDYKLDNEVEPFAKLQTLHITQMQKLESIYFTTLSFPCLNRLFVNYGCDNLKRLPFNSSSCDQGRGITIQGRSEWWNGLQWEDEATRTTFSSCLQH